MKHKLTDELRTARYTHLRTRFFYVVFLFFLIFLLLTGVAVAILSRLGLFPVLLRSPFVLVVSVYVMSLILSSLLAVYVSRFILKPVESLSDASKKVAAGDFSVSVSVENDTEEMHTMLTNFNTMVRQLSSIETLRDDFIANVSHEFKTPLAAIEGYAMLLQDEGLSQEEQAVYVKKILLNTTRLNDLTGNILLLSKLENLSDMGEKTTFRLDEQLREAILLLEPKWNKKDICFDLELPDTTYTGQEAMLRQVWINLIGNAVKFVPDRGNGKIAVRLMAQDNGVSVAISDNGIGMSEETIRHIFEKFYQGDSSRRKQGNGLGLPLCRTILEKCGGGIAVQSREGVGSVFTVHLPL